MKKFTHLLLWGLMLTLTLSSCKKGASTSGSSAPKPAKVKRGNFAEVIDLASDKKLKRQLADFEKLGIQKPLTIGDPDPEKLIKAARKFMGTPHRMGGLSRKGVDCSGLLVLAFAEIGAKVPHNSQAIAQYGTVVSNRKNLKRGDLVFFVRTYNTSNLITHAGIYLGDGKFIHTSSSKGVIVSNLDDPYYWKPKYVFGTRFF